MNTHKTNSFSLTASYSLFEATKQYPSEAMGRVVNEVSKFKSLSTNILIVGEYGTGKKRTAHMLHEISDRSDGPFHYINCELLYSDEVHQMLYGYAGYPENTLRPSKNAFEKAHRGTLYLENFNTLNQDLQYTLIRTQSEGNVVRIGTSSTHHTDVRIMVGLRPLVYQKFERFRRKTNLRMNMKSLFLPPLRDRKQDIPILSRIFLERFSKKYNRSVQGFSSEVMCQLYKYDWPGNIEQLRNTINQATCVTDHDYLQKQDLPDYLAASMTTNK